MGKKEKKDEQAGEKPADALLKEWGVQWQPDSSVQNCQGVGCNVRFKFPNPRRHHCRGCGHIFCNKCTINRKKLPELGYANPQRVCEQCLVRDFAEERRQILRRVGNSDGVSPTEDKIQDSCSPIVDMTPDFSKTLLENCSVVQELPSPRQDTGGSYHTPANSTKEEDSRQIEEEGASDGSLVSCEDWGEEWELGDRFVVCASGNRSMAGEPHASGLSFNQQHQRSNKASRRSVFVPNSRVPEEEDDVVVPPVAPSKRGDDDDSIKIIDFPPDFCAGITVKSRAKAIGEHSYSKHFDWLKDGGCLFSLSCNIGTALRPWDKRIVASAVNLSCFADELEENGVEPIDMHAESDLRKHIFLLTKASYALPGVTLSELTVALLTTPEYHRRCQPTSSVIWEPGQSGWAGEVDTFRFTKTLVSFVLKITIQFRVSELDPSIYPSLLPLCDGLRIDKALLLERTKRNKQVSDATKKAKSILLYHNCEGTGVICTNVTVIVNTSLPTIAARVLDMFGSRGAGEVATTAERTRQFFFDRQKK